MGLDYDTCRIDLRVEKAATRIGSSFPMRENCQKRENSPLSEVDGNSGAFFGSSVLAYGREVMNG